VVERHETNYVSLLTVRSKSNMGVHYGELSRSKVESIAKDLNVLVVPSYEFDSFEDIIENSKDLPSTREGFVIMDSNFKRIKVKNPKYVALHKLKDSLSIKNLIEIVIDQEQDEVLTYFPEFEEVIFKYSTILNCLKDDLRTLEKDLASRFEMVKENIKSIAIFLETERKHLYSFHTMFYNSIKNGTKLDIDKEILKIREDHIFTLIKYVKRNEDI